MVKSKSKDYLLYDVIERKEILIPVGNIMSACKEYGIDYTTLSKLGKNGMAVIHNRYIRLCDKDKIFTLIQLDTGKEYDCITNKTIFLHFGLPYSDNEAKYVYELRKKRQAHASIAGHVFKLKDGRSFSRTKKMKNESSVISDRYNLAYEIRQIKRVLYCRVHHALYAVSAKKLNSVSKMFGCKGIDLLKYIESKFTENMTWGNKHLWDIDHIKPCSEFDLRLLSEQQKCFHYTNLQPIWATSKIAEEMGEVGYVGNKNKNNSGLQYEYLMEAIFKKHAPELNAKEAAAFLFEKGIRKMIV